MAAVLLRTLPEKKMKYEADFLRMLKFKLDKAYAEKV
jgi:hypothetical protein